MGSMYEVYHPPAFGASHGSSYGAQAETMGNPAEYADVQPMHVSPYEYPYQPPLQNHYTGPYSQYYTRGRAPRFHELFSMPYQNMHHQNMHHQNMHHQNMHHQNMHHQYQYNSMQELYRHDYYQQQYAPRPQGLFPTFPTDGNGYYDAPAQRTSFTPPHSPSMGFYANNAAEPLTPTQSYRCQVKKSPAMYKCEFPDCGRVYTTISLFNAHRRIHLGIENAFQCNWGGGCGQNFSKPEDLADHLKTHS